MSIASKSLHEEGGQAQGRYAYFGKWYGILHRKDGRNVVAREFETKADGIAWLDRIEFSWAVQPSTHCCAAEILSYDEAESRGFIVGFRGFQP